MGAATERKLEIERIAEETVAARVRIRAFIELLEEKGILQNGEYAEKVKAVFERDGQEFWNHLHDSDE